MPRNEKGISRIDDGDFAETRQMLPDKVPAGDRLRTLYTSFTRDKYWRVATIAGIKKMYPLSNPLFKRDSEVELPFQLGCVMQARFLRTMILGDNAYGLRVNNPDAASFETTLHRMANIALECIEIQSDTLKPQGLKQSFREGPYMISALKEKRMKTVLDVSAHTTKMERLRALSYRETYLGLLRRTYKGKIDDETLAAKIGTECTIYWCTDQRRKWYITFYRGKCMAWCMDPAGRRLHSYTPLDDVDWCFFHLRPKMAFMGFLYLGAQQENVSNGANLIELMWEAWIEGLDHVEKHGLRAFPVYKDLGDFLLAFANASLSEYHLGSVLEKFISDFTQPVESDAWKAAPFDVMNSKLWQCMIHWPMAGINGIQFLTELIPDPDLYIVPMLLKKMSEVCEDTKTHLPTQRIVLGLFKFLVISNVNKRMGKYPPLDEHVMNMYYPETSAAAALKYNTIVASGLSLTISDRSQPGYMSYDDLSVLICKNGGMVDQQENPIATAKDTTSMSNPESWRYYKNGETIPLAYKRLIAQYMFRQHEGWTSPSTRADLAEALRSNAKGFNRDGSINRFAPEHKAILCGSHPKSTENKNIPREFVSFDHAIRTCNLMLDTIGAEASKAISGVMLGGTEPELERKSFDHYLHLMIKEYYGLEIDIDFKSWNGKQIPEYVSEYVRFLAYLYNIEDPQILSEIPFIFSRSSFLANGSSEQAVRQGGDGACEGIHQKIWTLISICSVMYAQNGFKESSTTTAAGDDTNVYITTMVSRDTPDPIPGLAACASKFIGNIIRIAHSLNQEIKPEQLNISTTVGKFLGQVHFSGQRLPRGPRTHCKNHGVTDSPASSYWKGRVEAVMAQGMALAKSTDDGRISYMSALISAWLNYTIWYIDIVPPEKRIPDEIFMCSLFCPIAIRGFGCGGAIAHCAIGRSDPSIGYFGFVARVLKAPTTHITPVMRTWLSNSICIAPAPKISLITVFSNPWSINSIKSPTCGDAFTRIIKEAMDGKVTNTILKELWKMGSDENKEIFVQALAATPNMSAVVGSACLEAGSWTYIDDVIAKVKSLTLIRILIENDPDSADILSRICGKFRALCKLHTQIILGIGEGDEQHVMPETHEVRRTMLYKLSRCPAAAVVYLRQMNLDYHLTRTGNTVDVHDTEEDCLGEHCTFSFGLQEVGDGSIPICTCELRLRDVLGNRPLFTNSWRHDLVTTPRGNTLRIVPTSGLMDSFLGGVSLPILGTALIKADRIASILGMHGGSNTVIPNLILQSFGIEPTARKRFHLSTSTDKTTRQHHMDPECRQMNSGIVNQNPIIAAMQTDPEMIVDNTDMQPNCNMYFNVVESTLAGSWMYRCYKQTPLLLRHFHGCKEEHCLKRTVDNVIKETPGTWRLKFTVSHAIMGTPEEMDRIFLNSGIQWNADIPARMEAMEDATNSLMEHLGTQPTAEQMAMNHKNVTIFQTLRVVDAARLALVYKKTETGDYLRSGTIPGLKETTMGSTSQGQAVVANCLDYKLFVVMLWSSAAQVARRDFNLGHKPMRVKDWVRATEGAPAIIKYVSGVGQVFSKTGTLYLLLSAMTDMTGIPSIPSTDLTTCYESYVRSNYASCLYTAESAFMFAKEYRVLDSGEVSLENRIFSRPEKGTTLNTMLEIMVARAELMVMSVDFSEDDDIQSCLSLDLLEYKHSWVLLDPDDSFLPCLVWVRKFTKFLQSYSSLTSDLPGKYEDLLGHHLFVRLVNIYGMEVRVEPDIIGLMRRLESTCPSRPTYHSTIQKSVETIIERVADTMRTERRSCSAMEAKFHCNSLQKSLVLTSSEPVLKYLTAMGWIDKTIAAGMPCIRSSQMAEIGRLLIPQIGTGNDTVTEYVRGKTVPPAHGPKIRHHLSSAPNCSFNMLLHLNQFREHIQPFTARVITGYIPEWDVLSDTMGYAQYVRPNSQQIRGSRHRMIPIEEMIRPFAGGNACIKIAQIYHDILEDPGISYGGCLTVHLAEGAGSIASYHCWLSRKDNEYNPHHNYVYNDIEARFTDQTARHGIKAESLFSVDEVLGVKTPKGVGGESMRDLTNPSQVSCLVSSILGAMQRNNTPVCYIGVDAEDPGWVEDNAPIDMSSRINDIEEMPRDDHSFFPKYISSDDHYKILWHTLASCLVLSEHDPLCYFKIYLEPDPRMAIWLTYMTSMYRFVGIYKPLASYAHNNEYYIIAKTPKMQHSEARRMGVKILDSSRTSNKFPSLPRDSRNIEKCLDIITGILSSTLQLTDVKHALALQDSWERVKPSVPPKPLAFEKCIEMMGFGNLGPGVRTFEAVALMVEGHAETLARTVRRYLNASPEERKHMKEHYYHNQRNPYSATVNTYKLFQVPFLAEALMSMKMLFCCLIFMRLRDLNKIKNNKASARNHPFTDWIQGIMGQYPGVTLYMQCLNEMASKGAWFGRISEEGVSTYAEETHSINWMTLGIKFLRLLSRSVVPIIPIQHVRAKYTAAGLGWLASGRSISKFSTTLTEYLDANHYARTVLDKMSNIHARRKDKGQRMLAQLGKRINLNNEVINGSDYFSDSFPDSALPYF